MWMLTLLVGLGLLLVERAPAGGLRISRRAELLKEFVWFVRERKVWWLTPIVGVLGLLSVFIVLTEQSVVLPFIYTVF